MKKIAVFVYGTLLTGFGNWRWLLSPQNGKPEFLSGFEMYSNGGFPGIIKTEDESSKIYGEVFYVDEETLKRLDSLEGYDENSDNNTFYNRIQVTLDSGEDAYVYEYVNSKAIKERSKVQSGNWRRFVGKGR